MADVATLVFDIDSSRARTAVTDLVKVQSASVGVARAAADAGKMFNAATGQMESVLHRANGTFRSSAEVAQIFGQSVRGLASEFNPAISAVLKLQDFQIRLNSAIAAGLVNSKDAKRLTDEYAESLRMAHPQVKAAEAAEKSRVAALEDTRRKYVPLYAVSKDYEVELARIDAVVKQSNLSEREHAQMLATLNSSYEKAAVAAGSFSKQQGNVVSNTANVFSQLNDIGVMLAAGQNPLQLALQQGTQLNQVWASMGAQGKTLGGVAGMLRGAFASMISPMSLLTLGVIAGAGALVNWAMSGDEASTSSKTLSDRLNSLESQLDASVEANKLARRSAVELFAEYGSGANSVRSAADAFSQLNTASVLREYDKSIKDANKEISGFGRNVSAITEAGVSARKSINDLISSGRNVRSIPQDLVYAVSAYDEMKRSVSDLSSELNLTLPVAEKLSQGLYNLSKATDISDRISIISAMRAEFENAGFALEKLPAPFLKLLTSAAEANSILSKIKPTIDGITSQTGLWASVMSGVLGTARGIAGAMSQINGVNISAAGYEAQLKVLRSGGTIIAANAAAERASILAEGKLRTQTLTRELGLRGRIQGTLETIAKLKDADLKAEVKLEEDRVRDAESAANNSSSSSAADLARTQKQFQSLRELIEEDTLFQFAEYEKRQTQLDNALSRKLLSEQNFNLIRSQLQTLYFGTEYEKQQLQFTMEQEQLDLALSQKLISEQRYAEEVSRIKAAQQNAELSGYQTFFGNMASAAKAGGDKTSAAVKAFSVAQGILNSYLAYTQVLADPSLIGRPFLRTALAASTLAAGLGAVASMKSGGGSSAASTATASARQEPTRTTLVKLEGDEWLVNLADSLITQIQDASKDGRMIVMRDY